MISSADDYIWVTPGVDIRIDGGIMPVRDVANDGTWKVLRGEDVAFCLEGAYERCGAGAIIGPDYYSKYTRNVDKVIIGSRWRAAVRSLRDAADRAINDVPGYPMSDSIPAQIPESATIPMLYGNLMFDKSKLRSDDSKFNPKMPMRADDVRDVFHDMALLRAFHHNGTFTRSTQEFSSEAGGWDGHTAMPARDDVLFAHSVMNWRPGNLSGLSGWNTTRADKGTLTFVPRNNGDADFRTVARYCLVEELDIDFTEFDNESNVTTNRKWHHMWVPPQSNGNSMTDSMQELALAAEKISGSYTGKMVNGRFLRDDEIRNGYGFDVVVRLKSVRAAVYLDDHTDFSGIGWRR